VTHTGGRHHPARPAAPSTRKAREEARSEIAPTYTESFGAVRRLSPPA